MSENKQPNNADRNRPSNLNNVLGRGLHGVRSILKTSVFRLDRLPDREVDARLAVCRSCPGGHVVLKRNGLPLSCGPVLAKPLGTNEAKPCGCLLRQKARDSKEGCPFGYWAPVPGDVESPPGHGRSNEQGAASSNLVARPAQGERTLFYIDVDAVRERKLAKRKLAIERAQAECEELPCEDEVNNEVNSEAVDFAVADAAVRQAAPEKRPVPIATASKIEGKPAGDSEVAAHNGEALPETLAEARAGFLSLESKPAAASRSKRPLYDFFDRVCVVNLDRRRDRLDQFYSHISSVNWPFKYPERFRAIDGRVVKPPAWWRAGPGAWGCQQSHLQIIEQALMDGVDRVLILEDDVFFKEDFRSGIELFLDSVPSDWEQIYFGGQHLFQRRNPPTKINDHVIAPHNVNRTHAYALSSSGLLKVYRWLTDYVSHHRSDPSNHVDHRLGALHETGNLRVYAPMKWLAGQSEGHSNIRGKDQPARVWDNHRIHDPSSPFVAVMGVHRSGSSCLAGVLHKLGVHMGDRLKGYESTGGFEAVGLSRICEKAFPFPKTKLEMNKGALRRQLQNHVRYVQNSANEKGKPMAGGKYPHLCALGEDLGAVCGTGLKLIDIDRPLGESIASLKTRSQKAAGWLAITDEEAEQVQSWLYNEKKKYLEGREHLRVHYHDLLNKPRETVENIVRYLGLDPTLDAVESAVNHVKQDLGIHAKVRDVLV